MALLLRHFGKASGRVGATEFGALGILPLVALVVTVTAIVPDGPVSLWIAWGIGAAAVVPLWALTAKRCADLGLGGVPAHLLALTYALHLAVAGSALVQGQSGGQWLFFVPAPGAIPADGVLNVLWIASGLGVLGCVFVLSSIPGQPRENAFGPDPRVRLTAVALEQEDSMLEQLAARLLAAPSRAFANTGRLTLVVVPILMLAAGLLRYDPAAGQLTTVLQTSSIGGVSILEGILRGGLVAILFAPPLILLATIAVPIILGTALWAVVRWRVYGRAEALAVSDEVRAPDPGNLHRPAG